MMNDSTKLRNQNGELGSMGQQYVHLDAFRTRTPSLCLADSWTLWN